MSQHQNLWEHNISTYNSNFPLSVFFSSVRLRHCNSGWPHTHNSPDLALPVLGLRVLASISVFFYQSWNVLLQCHQCGGWKVLVNKNRNGTSHSFKRPKASAFKGNIHSPETHSGLLSAVLGAWLEEFWALRLMRYLLSTPTCLPEKHPT